MIWLVALAGVPSSDDVFDLDTKSEATSESARIVFELQCEERKRGDNRSCDGDETSSRVVDGEPPLGIDDTSTTADGLKRREASRNSSARNEVVIEPYGNYQELQRENRIFSSGEAYWLKPRPYVCYHRG